MKILCNDRIIAGNVSLADRFSSRFKGLMGKPSLSEGEGLLLIDCGSIHSFFMKIPITAVYLSSDMTVLAVEILSPWRIGRYVKNSAHVLELEAKSGIPINVGDILKFMP